MPKTKEIVQFTCRERNHKLFLKGGLMAHFQNHVFSTDDPVLVSKLREFSSKHSLVREADLASSVKKRKTDDELRKENARLKAELAKKEKANAA